MEVRAASAPTPRLDAMSGPAFTLVAQGAKQVVLNGRVFEYAAGQYLVGSVELPVSTRITEASADRPFLGFSMTFKSSQIAELLPETPASQVPAQDTLGIAVSDASFELLDVVVRYLRIATRADEARVLGPGTEREILWRLVTGPQGAMLRQLGRADSQLSQISRAVQWIRRNYSAPVSVDELARLTGMSSTSFYRHFRAVTAMTPIQYQKQIRLQEARVLLRDGAQNVTEVSFEVGYESPSQFSREYRRHFGISPSGDAAGQPVRTDAG